jgi:hypothetical protein
VDDGISFGNVWGVSSSLSTGANVGGLQ